jgi:hypothetical protein
MSHARWLPAPLLGVVLGVVLGAGCVDDTLSLSINGFQAITEMNMCLPTATSTFTLAQGTLDVGMVQVGAAAGFRGYLIAPTVVNNLVERATTSTTETDAIDITGFDVELRPANDDAVLQAALPASQRAYFVPVAGGRIFPGGGTGVTSQATILFEVIPVQVALAMSSHVQAGNPPGAPRPLLVHMRPVGNRAGLRINGGWVDFPLTICKFCLSNPPEACPTGGFPAKSISIGCFPWQDMSTTCCISGNFLLCGARVPTSTM